MTRGMTSTYGPWLALLLAGCAAGGDPQASCGSPEPRGIVRREGAVLRDEDGVTIVPRGIGSYPLLDHAGRGDLRQVDAILERARAMDRWLVRTTAHIDGGEHPGRTRDDDGALREDGLAALDRVIAAATAHRVRLILVLTNHWSDYGGAPAILRAVAPGEGLPADAFYSDERAIAAHEEYVRAVVARTSSVDGTPHATNPTIFAWELVNEARCDDPRFCDPDTLTRWSARMAAAIRDAGGAQLVAWGGVGFTGEHGESFDAIASRGGVDVVTLHLYPDLAGALSLGDPDASLLAAIARGTRAIRDRARRAREHRVALLVEEVGWRAPAHVVDAERALIFGAWAAAAHEEGVALLPWMIGEPGRPDYDGYLIDPDRHPRTVEILACD